MPTAIRQRSGITLVVVLCATLALALLPAYSPASDKPRGENPDVLWKRDVAPLLDKKCLKCHAGVRQYGGLDLRSLETILRGGDRGAAIVPGRTAESRILQFIQPNSDPHMPPDPKRQLTPEEIGVLKSWIAAMPVPTSKLASSTSKTETWVSEYLLEYRRLFQARRIPPSKLDAGATIDWFLQADWRRDGTKPAGLSDDASFVRRVYLDVAGRISTNEERSRFLADRTRDKRSQLVDNLLASDDYPRRMREVFDTALMGRPNRKNERERVSSGWREFLEDAFRANRPWNETVRDMLVARETKGARKGAMWFIAERDNSHQAIAEAVAPVVFGTQIACAQCHNHPLLWEIEQRHYWGMVAAFNRSTNVKTESGLGVGESAVGGFINFANLKKESQPAKLIFPNGSSVPERIPGMDEKVVDTPDLYVVPPVKEGQKVQNAAIPKFSRRAAFADVATRDNPLLARAFVNRMWAVLMGRGIVEPVDQIDSRHPASHPELLEWLATDFEKSGYDIKRLVRVIVSSRAYQLDSRPRGNKAPLPETFARSIERTLSAEQLLRSLKIATGAKTDDSSSDEVERAFIAVFPEVMQETYNPSLQQALFLSNSPILDTMLTPADANTTARLLTLKSAQAQVREAFVTVLGRLPDASEQKQCQALLAGSPPERGVKDLLWALLTSAEFKVNH